MYTCSTARLPDRLPSRQPHGIPDNSKIASPHELQEGAGLVIGFGGSSGSLCVYELRCTEAFAQMYFLSVSVASAPEPVLFWLYNY
jgi:hypothetical protein